MANLLEGITEKLLMGPGPSSVHQSVYDALARPTIGHLDPYFIQIMDEIKGQLQQVIGTKNRRTLRNRPEPHDNRGGGGGFGALLIDVHERFVNDGGDVQLLSAVHAREVSAAARHVECVRHAHP